MKTKLLRKIRKRFEYKISGHYIYIWDKKHKQSGQYESIKSFIHDSCIDLNLSYLYCYNRKSTIRRNRKYFDSLK